MKRKYIYSGAFAAFAALGCFVYLCLVEPSTLLQFRTTNSDYQWWAFDNPDRLGLADINASGSGVLHEKALLNNLKEIMAKHKDIYILDLSKDHNLYANGRPWSWFNWTKSDDGVKESYKKRYDPDTLKDNFKLFLRRNFYPRPHQCKHETEKEFVERLGFHYLNVTVTKRHVYNAETIDRFLAFLEGLPEGAWIHFHCDGGNSRTTTLITIYDIVLNGTKVPLETIVRRQRALGGVDMFDTTTWKFGTWDPKMLVKRKQMIEDFYQYRNDPNGYGKKTWSQWLTINGKETG